MRLRPPTLADIAPRDKQCVILSKNVDSAYVLRRSSLSRSTEMKSIKSPKRIESQKPDRGGGRRQAHRKEATPTLVVGVSSKKRGSTFVIITLENLDGF